MPPMLGPLFPITFAGKPPGMAARDLGLFARFRQRLPAPYEGFHFNVALGTPPDAPPDMRVEILKAWTFLNARRIDAVGVLPERFDIIEFRRGAGQAALGALVMYAHLWRQDPPDPRPITLLLVSDRVDIDTQSLAQNQGIQVLSFTPS